MQLSIKPLAALALMTLFACSPDESEITMTATIDRGTPAEADEEAAHTHDEEPLGSITLGEYSVELKQGHGVVAAGKEGHLVVKLPYNDAGATTVRAWIGSEDRTSSYVGKGTYAESHDDYDIHANAPDPLPDGAMWWVEIVKPDGTKLTGSIKPL